MKAFITGITGQDGYYLTKLLLEKNMKFLCSRRSSNFNTQRIDPLISNYSNSENLSFLF